MPRKRAAPIEASRLKILASTENDDAFLAHVAALVGSGKRQQRETALESLVERPLPESRPLLRDLYLELHTDGSKRDSGAIQRSLILRILREISDQRDADIALIASETFETAMGQDITRNLRSLGLMLLADLKVELLPYYAVEHLDDANYEMQESEPAATALQILLGIGEYVAVYHWLRTSGPSSPAAGKIFEMFTDAPQAIVQRLAADLVQQAVRRRDEPLCTTLAETILRLELRDAYGAFDLMLSSGLSDELYAYVALLLARTDDDALLAVLERQLDDHRRRALVLDALRLRDTPKQRAIIARWEEEHA